MARYEVILRSKGDGWMPGDILVDPERADLLIKRGFVRRLDDNIADQLVEADAKAEGQPMSYQAAIDYGYSEKAAAAVSKGNDPKYVQEETAKLKARDKHRASRPEAEAVSKELDVHINEVYDLSDVDYADAVRLLEPSNDSVAVGQPAETLAEHVAAYSDEELDEKISTYHLDVPEGADRDAKIAAVLAYAEAAVAKAGEA